MNWPPVRKAFRMHLRCFARKNRNTVCHETLFPHSQFPEARRKLKGDVVFVVVTGQLDLNFKPHRGVSAPASEILGLHKISYPIHTPGDLLKDFKRKPDSRLARPVLSNQ